MSLMPRTDTRVLAWMVLVCLVVAAAWWIALAW